MKDAKRYRVKKLKKLNALRKKYRDKELKEKREEAQQKREDSIEHVKDSIERQKQWVKDSLERVAHDKKLRNIPNNPKYYKWKSNYTSELKKAQYYVNRCEKISDKYVRVNAFGRKVYNRAEFSDSDGRKYKKSLKMLKKHNNNIYELEQNGGMFYRYWYDTVPNRKKKKSMNLSNYWEKKTRI